MEEGPRNADQPGFFTFAVRLPSEPITSASSRATATVHPVAARLVAIRKSEPAAEQARKKALRERTKKGRAAVDVRTLEAAGYLFVLTNLSDTITTESVLQLYRLRWQIEMKFKTLKSVLHLAVGEQLATDSPSA